MTIVTLLHPLRSDWFSTESHTLSSACLVWTCSEQASSPAHCLQIPENVMSLGQCVCVCVCVCVREREREREREKWCTYTHHTDSYFGTLYMYMYTHLSAAIGIEYNAEIHPFTVQSKHYTSPVLSLWLHTQSAIATQAKPWLVKMFVKLYPWPMECTD